MNEPRITVHVPKDMAQKIDKLAKTLGTTKTNLGSIMIGIGLEAMTNLDLERIGRRLDCKNGYT